MFKNTEMPKNTTMSMNTTVLKNTEMSKNTVPRNSGMSNTSMPKNTAMRMLIGICSLNLKKAVEPEDTKQHSFRNSVGWT